MSHALLIVDYQNDFVSGSLAVPDAESILPVIKQLAASQLYQIVAATRDWHPADHCSFVEQGGQWPSHCVQGTDGAAYAGGVGELVTPGWHFIKGYYSYVEQYSGAQATPPISRTPALQDALARAGVTDVDVVGLALDYCVTETALDLRRYGFHVRVIEEATRPVTASPTWGAALWSAGVEFV